MKTNKNENKTVKKDICLQKRNYTNSDPELDYDDYDDENVHKIERVSLRYQRDCEAGCEFVQESCLTLQDIKLNIKNAKFNNDREGKFQRMLHKWLNQILIKELKETGKKRVAISEYQAFSSNLTHFIYKGKIYKEITYIVSSDYERIRYAECDEIFGVKIKAGERTLPKNYLNLFSGGIFNFNNGVHYADIEIEAYKTYLKKIRRRCSLT